MVFGLSIVEDIYTWEDDSFFSENGFIFSSQISLPCATAEIVLEGHKRMRKRKVLQRDD